MAVSLSGNNMTDTGGAGTDTLVIAAFTLTGSNRNIAVGMSVRTTTAKTFTVTRSSDTFTEVINNLQDSLGLGALHMGTNEPTASSASLTVQMSASVNHWCMGYIAVQDSDQTTRYNNVTLNTDHVDSVSQAVTTTSGDMVVDFYASRQSATVVALSDFTEGGSQTLGNENLTATSSGCYLGSSYQASGGASVTMSWTAPSAASTCNHMNVNFIQVSSTPPTATCPTSGTHATMTSASGTAVSGMSIASGSNQVSEVTIATNNNGTWTFTASGSVVITNNGTNSVTLDTSTSDAEYNTVLGTGVYQGASGFHGKDTTTLTADDGVLTPDNDTFYLLNDPYNLKITSTSDSHANIVATAATMGAILSATESTETLSAYAEDDTVTPLSDSQSLTLVEPTTMLKNRRSIVGKFVRFRDNRLRWIRRRRERR